MNRHEEFLKAYDAYPSQDNEGYVPDRGGFKCGFGAAWDLLHANIQTQAQDANHWRHEAGQLKDALAQAHAKLAQAIEALQFYSDAELLSPGVTPNKAGRTLATLSEKD